MGCAPMAWAASIKRSLLRAVMATRAPAAASDSAMPRPMPALPPVTSATAFFRFMIVYGKASIGFAGKNRFHEAPVDRPGGADPLLLHFETPARQNARQIAGLGREFVAAEHLAQQVR